MCLLEPSMKHKQGFDTSLCRRCKRNFYRMSNKQLTNKLIEFGVYIPHVSKDKVVVSCNGFIDSDTSVNFIHSIKLNPVDKMQGVMQ